MFERFRAKPEAHEDQQPYPSIVEPDIAIQETLILGCDDCPNRCEIAIPESVRMALPVVRFPLTMITKVNLSLTIDGERTELGGPDTSLTFHEEKCLNGGVICRNESQIQTLYNAITLNPEFLDNQLGIETPNDAGKYDLE